jgi:hypothetical protein
MTASHVALYRKQFRSLFMDVDDDHDDDYEYVPADDVQFEYDSESDFFGQSE